MSPAPAPEARSAHRRDAISVGDLVTAFGRLAPTDSATCGRIAHLLGVGWQAEEPPDAEPRRPAEPTPAPPPARDATDADITRPPPAVLQPARSFRDPAVASLLLQVRAAPRRAPGWLERAAPLAAPGGGTAPAEAEVEPLFEPRYTRSILGIALATEIDAGELDLASVVATISRGQALRAVPRLPVGSLAHGVQLLLDRGAAMLPFLRDLLQIERWVRRVAGEDRVSVLGFAACPGRSAGPGPVRTRRPYFPHHQAARGVRVLCVTDLGIGRPLRGEAPATAEEWLDFEERLRKVGCPLLVLNPYPADRWPAELRGRLAILHWSRTASAGSAARAVRGRAGR